MSDSKARTWRRWFTFSVAQFVVAGYFLMAYGIGRIVRATSTLDTSVGELVHSGKVDVAADPVETDNLDIYIRDPTIILNSEVTPLNVTDNILISRDKID